MSTKEQILQIASDPHRGKELSEKMLEASKGGKSQVKIQIDDQKEITLVRITEVTKPFAHQ